MIIRYLAMKVGRFLLRLVRRRFGNQPAEPQHGRRRRRGG